MKHLPQEIEAWYIIPAIRKEIANCLIKEHKASYEKVGNILGISKAAISQYAKGKRAGKIKLPKEAITRVCVSCKRLSKNQTSSLEEIQEILNMIKSKSLSCCICGKLKEGILEDCKEIKFQEENYR